MKARLCRRAGCSLVDREMLLVSRVRMTGDEGMWAGGDAGAGGVEGCGMEGWVFRGLEDWVFLGLLGIACWSEILQKRSRDASMTGWEPASIAETR